MQSVITESLDFAIKKYLESKQDKESIEYNSFFVVVIRLLCLIYDELDIINPYLQNNGSTFDQNLAKYDFEMDKILDFKVQLDNTYTQEINHQTNTYFVNIQKVIIDMLMYRKKKIGIEENKLNEFYNLLYTPNNTNPIQIAYNFQNAKVLDEVDKYYQEQLAKHQDIKPISHRVVLNPEAYELCDVDNFNELNTAQLEKVNDQIYNHFGIKETAINKEFLLEQAIEEEKKNKNKITTGNGYVDILLIMGIICTIIMTVTVITMLFV
jgi:hypothetical protein